MDPQYCHDKGPPTLRPFFDSSSAISSESMEIALYARVCKRTGKQDTESVRRPYLQPGSERFLRPVFETADSRWQGA
jgi:hypothetical protein